MVAPGRLAVLNIEVDISSSSIWKDRSRGDLWIYNLHYFDDLMAEGAADRRDWHLSLIERWINENPAGMGTGWEPYPLSLRIVNWIKWGLTTGFLSAAALDSLAAQVRYLLRRLEYHTLGNHLLANAKAIYFAGLFFDGDEGRDWRRRGMALMADQVREQVLADGAHVELSPMYHLIITEDLLDCINAAGVFGDEIPRGVAAAAVRMVSWADAMQHPDGQMPFFNDATFGIAPAPRAVADYAVRLALESAPIQSSGITTAGAGYVRLDAGAARLFADVAVVGPSYQPGHAHADSLSFELSLGGQRICVNSGTSVYGASEERLRQRGTAAHNCLVIDGQNSSDVWSGFRVGSRAEIRDRQLSQSGGQIRLSASHDGYVFLPGRPVHRRSWSLRQGRLLIEDQINGSGKHLVELYFHLHPEVAVAETGDLTILNLPDGRSVNIIAAGLAMAAERSTWHPGFGLSVPTTMLHATVATTLPWSSSVEIIWSD